MTKIIKPKQRIIKRVRKYNTSVLGLDCSSSTIGWGLITSELRLAAYGHIKPLNNKYPIVERLSDTYNRISALCVELKPTYVAIEDIFMYMKGKSQAKTIVVLASFNRIAALAAYHNSQNVYFYSVHEIRKSIKDLALKSKKIISKDEMPNIITEKLDHGFSFLKNKLGNVAKETYDEADGIAVAWCHILQGIKK